jgi:hypothetical protein
MNTDQGVGVTLFQAVEGDSQVSHMQIVLGKTILQEIKQSLSIVGIVDDLEDSSGRTGEHPPHLLGIPCHKLSIVAVKLGESFFC